MLVGVGGLVLRISSDGDGRMPGGGGKNQTPKKSHAHAKFPSLENFQKKLNDITQQNLQIVLTKKNQRKSIKSPEKMLAQNAQIPAQNDPAEL